MQRSDVPKRAVREYGTRGVVMRLRLAGLGLVVVIATAVASGQTSQQRLTFRSGVDIIEIDVSVIDGNGRPITDLDAEEFSVDIDGESRRVVQAQFIALRPSREDRPPTLESEEIFYTSNIGQPRGRLIVIAVDEESMLFGEGRHVTRAAGAFVDTLTPFDRVALMAVPTGRYIDFTHDHERIRREVETMSGLGERVQRSLNIGIFEAFQISEYGDQDLRGRVTARECGTGLAQDISCATRVYTETRMIVHEVRQHALNTRRGLESILRALRDIEGPKALVWISGGLVIARDSAFLKEIEDLAAASRTTVYVIKVDAPLTDIHEASAPPSPQEDARMREAGLQAVTALARGEIFRAHYNPGPLFDRLEEELSGYYLLGVEARPTDRDEERRGIKVSVRRSGARVRARREVRFTDPFANESADERLARALRSPVPTTELPLRVATYAYPEAGQMRVTIAAEVGGEVDFSSDVWVAFALRDLEGTVLASGKRQVTATQVDTPGGPVLEYSRSMFVAPGTYVLRIVVLDAAGRCGGVEHLLHADLVPDRPLAVSDLMVADWPSEDATFHPPVEARVASGDLLAYLELHAPAPSSSIFEQTHVVVEVADDESAPARASGDAVLDGPTDAPHRTVSAAVSVTHLPPGRYVARALVMRDSTEVARLHRPFRITESP